MDASIVDTPHKPSGLVTIEVADDRMRIPERGGEAGRGRVSENGGSSA